MVLTTEGRSNQGVRVFLSTILPLCRSRRELVMFLEATEKKHIENEASNPTGWHSKGSARLPGRVLDLCIMYPVSCFVSTWSPGHLPSLSPLVSCLAISQYHLTMVIDKGGSAVMHADRYGNEISVRPRHAWPISSLDASYPTSYSNLHRWLKSEASSA
jgi:hypothetical protein